MFALSLCMFGWMIVSVRLLHEVESMRPQGVPLHFALHPLHEALLFLIYHSAVLWLGQCDSWDMNFYFSELGPATVGTGTFCLCDGRYEADDECEAKVACFIESITG
jgi:hypothetical protein